MKQNIVYICIYGVMLFLIHLVLRFYLFAILFLLRSVLCRFFVQGRANCCINVALQ